MTGMMMRYHLRCKNSLLLLKLSYVESRRCKFHFSFWIHIFILYYWIHLHCHNSISSLNGITLWKLIFPILVPHWILVDTFVCTVITVHGSFNPFWTLLCGVYCPYGLIFCRQRYNRNVTAICLAKSVVFNLPVSYEQDITDCVLFECSCCA